MAQDSPDNIAYYLHILASNKAHLGAIRHWQNLKIAFDGNNIWVKDFTAKQLEAREVRTIPNKRLYYAQQGKLFPINSLLPNRNVPSLLWMGIERGLPVQLPALNLHYFGIQEKIAFKLVRNDAEKDAFAMVTSLKILGNYIETAPAIRLQTLKWAILSDENCMILGKPVLPIQGEILWKKKHFLVPAGHDFELPVLEEKMDQLLNPTGQYWVVWDAEGNYYLLDKKTPNQLSISSFRISLNTEG
jgi:MoxR-vWA-beta-propeller ternary system domain bpX2